MCLMCFRSVLCSHFGFYLSIKTIEKSGAGGIQGNADQMRKEYCRGGDPSCFACLVVRTGLMHVFSRFVRRVLRSLGMRVDILGKLLLPVEGRKLLIGADGKARPKLSVKNRGLVAFLCCLCVCVSICKQAEDKGYCRILANQA